MQNRLSFLSVTSFVSALLCVSLLLVTGCAKKPGRTTKVTVAGEAMTRVEPDAAVVVLSVVTQNAQALVAQQTNARKSDAVANAIRTAGGSAVEIKTSDYTLQPQYDYRDNSLPKIVGYDARNRVIVTMSDFKNVGAVIDAASGSGANSIESVSFVLRETSPARGQALADATQQAMNKARSIAQALGGRVLRVVEESESATVAHEAELSYAGQTAGLSNRQSVTPITPGQLSIKSNVQVIVEIES
jgi:uncharacterized protein YggE